MFSSTKIRHFLLRLRGLVGQFRNCCKGVCLHRTYCRTSTEQNNNAQGYSYLIRYRRQRRTSGRKLRLHIISRPLKCAPRREIQRSHWYNQGKQIAGKHSNPITISSLHLGPFQRTSEHLPKLIKHSIPWPIFSE